MDSCTTDTTGNNTPEDKSRTSVRGLGLIVILAGTGAEWRQVGKSLDCDGVDDLETERELVGYLGNEIFEVAGAREISMMKSPADFTMLLVKVIAGLERFCA